MSNATLPAIKEFVVSKGQPLEIFINKYSRLKEDGQYQTFKERITEVIKGNFSLTEYANDEDDRELNETLDLAVRGLIPMSGRHLQHGDMDQKNKQGEVFSNCSSSMFCFSKFYLLLCGSGVGRSYNSDINFVDWDYLPNTRFVLSSSHKDYESWIESLEEAIYKYDSDGEDVRWFVVDDSKEGWAKIVAILETAAFHKNNKEKLFIFDFSKIRCKGTPILGQQGRPASGPVPLIRALNQLVSIKGAGYKPWKQAIFIDHYLSACVALGGVRRSARLCLKYWKDRDIIEFIDIKRGGWLYTANNSIAVDAEFWEQARNPKPSHARRVLEAAVAAGYYDKTGEPGFVNIDQFTWKTVDIEKITAETVINSDYDKMFGGVHYKTKQMISYTLEKVKNSKYPFVPNPCCVPGNVEILTDIGYRRIEDCVGEEVSIWNGFQFSKVKPFSVGRYKTVKVYFSDGTSLPCTLNHEFIVKPGKDYDKVGVKIKAKDLKIGMRLEKFELPVVTKGNYYGTDKEAYTQGFYAGDGNTGYEYSSIHEPKYPCISRLIGSFSEPNKKYKTTRWNHGPMKSKSWVPVHADINYCLNWFAGVCDSDGCVTSDKNGNGLQVTSVNKNFLIKIRLMLSRLGVRTKVIPGRKAGYRMLPDGKGGNKKYYCQNIYRLLVGNMDTYNLIKLGLAFERLQVHGDIPQRDARQFITITKIKESETCENYCFDEPLNHTGTFNGIVTGQSEIVLASFGAFCIVGDTNLSLCSTLLDSVKAVSALARMLVRTNTMNFIYKEEVKRTNRIGVSLIGIHEFAANLFNYDFYDLLNEEKSQDFWNHIKLLRESVESAANNISKALGLANPHTYTCLKPSGTTSKVMECTEAANLPSMPHYLRWIQFQNADAILKELINRGYPVKDISKDEVRFDSNGNKYTVKGYLNVSVVGFPTKQKLAEILGDRVVCSGDITIEQHFKWLELLEKYWLGENSNNMISYTIKYSPEKVTYQEFMDAILKNQPNVRCCSMMPQTDNSAYIYTPEQSLTKLEYETYVQNINRLDRESVDENALDCEGGACGVDLSKNASIASEFESKASN